MKTLILTSDGLRHSYFAKKIFEKFPDTILLIEKKKNYYEDQIKGSQLIEEHFKKIKYAEKEWFDIACKKIEYNLIDDLNNKNILYWVEKQNFGLVCLFGTVILNNDWIKMFPKKIINLHLGLSPYYRGSATLFWPFVNNELEYLGTTIHIASEKVDAGEILHRVYANILPKQNYYDVTFSLIKDSINIFPKIISEYLTGHINPYPQEKIKGKYYKKVDFNEKHLMKVIKHTKKGLSQKEITEIKKKRKCLY